MQANTDLETIHEEILMPIENKVLRVGDKGPDFALTEASTGEDVSLDDLAGQPLMIIFGRGTW